MVTLIGFNGPEPHAVILWEMNGQYCSKTICYTAEEEQGALNRFYTAGDFYNRYEKAAVVYKDQSFTEYGQLQGKKGA